MSFIKWTAPNFQPPKIKNGTAAGKAHMARVAKLNCVCCGISTVQVHHCISGRYGQRKASDFHTLPLCWNHHLGPEGIHTDKAAWEAKWGMDYDYLPVVADMLAGELTGYGAAYVNQARLIAERNDHD
jgi:hypothetical protein